jgi:DNA polymerase III delta prime subunit
MIQEILWVERYRPHTITEAILPSKLKQTLQSFVDSGNIPNLLLSGRPGIGKTTAAMAMLDELGYDYIMINASLEGNIDTLRTKIQDFASSVSFSGNRKYVILDEADYLTNATQPALRNFIEQYSSNCGFIITVNNKQRIIDALHSRFSTIDFQIPKEEKAILAKQFFVRIVEILNKENIKYEKAALVNLIQKYFPDWRKTLNELQRYSASGVIDSGILTDINVEIMAALLKLIREKSFTGMRKFIAETQDLDYERFYRTLYDVAYDYFNPKYIPQLVISMGNYLDKQSRSIDPEITLVSFLTELMIEAEWKN